MNENLQLMLKVAEGRHLRSEESQLFKAYYAELPQRLEGMNQLQAQESSCIRQALDPFFARFPNMQNASDTRSKAERDMAYLYRAAALAMVQQDLGSISDKADFVFAIFANLGFPAGTMDAAYDLLRQQMQALLSPQTWTLAKPYFQVLSEQRLALWRDWQHHMPALIQSGVKHVLQTWPQLAKLPDVETHLAKDMDALLKAVGHAMLAQDAEAVNARKAWLYSYFKTLRFDMQMVYQTYADLSGLAEPLLQPDTLAAVKPWLALLAQDT